MSRWRSIPVESWRLVVVSATAFAVFLVTYFLAIQTQTGQRWDNAAHAVSENATGTPRGGANDLLGIVNTGSLLLATALLAAILLIQGRKELALVPPAIVGVSLFATEVFKYLIFSRPDLTPDPFIDFNSYPSGHATIAASLALAAILSVPARVRALTGIAAFALAAGGGVTVVIATWHRPSDAIGGFAISLAVAAAVLALVHAWKPSLAPQLPSMSDRGAGVVRRIEVIGVLGGVFLFAIAILLATIYYGSEIDWTKPDAAFLVSLSVIVAAAGVMVGALMRTLGRATPDASTPPRGERTQRTKAAGGTEIA